MPSEGAMRAAKAIREWQESVVRENHSDQHVAEIIDREWKAELKRIIEDLVSRKPEGHANAH